MIHTVTVIPGDGIGPEVVEAMQKVIFYSGVQIEWETQFAGEFALNRYGNALPQFTIDSIRKNKVAIKGPTNTPVGTGYGSINVELRKIFDLYANIRPVRFYKGVSSHYPGLSLTVVRENTEGEYTGTEEYYDDEPTIVRTVSEMSYAGCERVFRKAFEYARAMGLTKVTGVHKGNILQLSHGMLFGKAGENVSGEYPELEYSYKLMDNMAMQLVTNPYQFQVIVAPNMFGDILSDMCAGLANGSLGLAPGANIGNEFAIFEAVHGTAMDLAGQNKANPTAMILCGAGLLDHLGESVAASQIREAVTATIEAGTTTGDVNKTNPVSTSEMVSEIINRVVRLRG